MEFLEKNRAWLMGLSILWIIAFHYCYYSALLPNPVLGFLFGKGYLGVDVFMFLSAYGLCFSLEKNTIGHYYARRAKRLFPMYIFFLAVVLAFFSKNYQDNPLWLFLFQATGVAAFRHVDVEWFVPSLICLYVSFPLVYKAVRWVYDKYPYAIIAIVFVLNLVAEPLGKVMMPAFPMRFGIIILGITAYLGIKASDTQKLWVVFTVSALLVAAFRFSEQMTGSMLIPLILLALSSSGVTSMPLSRPISFIGKHSLEIYLAQNLALNHYFLHNEGPFITKCLVSLAIIVFASMIFHWFHKGTWLLFDKIHETRISHNRA